MYTLYGSQGSGSASIEAALALVGALDLLAAVVSKWAGSRPHLKQARPAFHEALLRIEAQSAVAPVFARHWLAG